MLKSIFLPTVTKTHTVKCVLWDISPKQLLSVVTDVDSYSQFLPLCKHSEILRHSPCGKQFDATLKVGMIRDVLEEEYISRVTVNIDEMTVEATSIKSISGWLENLSSKWKLRPIHSKQEEDDSNSIRTDNQQNLTSKNYAINEKHNNNNNILIGTQIDFTVSMDVSDPIISTTLDHTLEEVAKGQVKAFHQRCLEIQY